MEWGRRTQIRILVGLKKEKRLKEKHSMNPPKQPLSEEGISWNGDTGSSWVRGFSRWPSNIRADFKGAIPTHGTPWGISAAEVKIPGQNKATRSPTVACPLEAREGTVTHRMWISYWLHSVAAAGQCTSGSAQQAEAVKVLGSTRLAHRNRICKL